MPKVITNPDPTVQYREILLPMDISKGAYRGLKHALDLAKENHSKIHILHVIDEHTKGQTAALSSHELALEKYEEQARLLMKEFEAKTTDLGLEMIFECVRGVPHKEICKYAETHSIDLIVMGMHGSEREGWPHIGNTTDKVVESSLVPVLPVW